MKIELVKPIDFVADLAIAGAFLFVDSKFLLLKRSPDKQEGATWCLPGGKIEEGESPLDAAIRETFEEAGIALREENMQDFGVIYFEKEGFKFPFHIYGYNFLEMPSLSIGLDESTEGRWVTLEEALHLPLIRGGDYVLNFCHERRES